MICIIPLPTYSTPVSRRPISPAPFDACSIKLVQTVACLEKFANKYVELLNILINVQNKKVAESCSVVLFFILFCFISHNFFLLYFCVMM